MIKIQKTIRDFVANNNSQTDVNIRLLDLVSKIGELSKEYLKATNYGNEIFINTPQWEEELADVLFSVIVLANRSSVNLDRALKNALTKHASRIESTGQAGSTI